MTSALRNACIAPCLALSLALAGAAAAQTDTAKPADASTDAVVLKPVLTKDAVYRFTYHLERTDVNIIAGAGGDSASEVNMDADVTLTVKEVSENGAAIEFHVRSIKATAKLPAGEFAYDSNKPEDDKDRDNQAFLGFRPAYGMKLLFNTDAVGVITTVTGDPIAPQGRLAPTVNQAFADHDNLKFRFNNILNARRERVPTKAGETWMQVHTFLAPQVGRFETSLTHTLKAVKDGVAAIDSVGDMKIFPAKEGMALAFELKDTSILATSTWPLVDCVARTFEMHRAFTLDGSAQGLSVQRKTDERVVFTRVN